MLECMAGTDITESKTMEPQPLRNKKKKKKKHRTTIQAELQFETGETVETVETRDLERDAAASKVAELELQLQESHARSRLVTELSRLPAVSIGFSGGFQRSKKINDATLSDLATSLNADTASLSLTKQLHDCKHPAIKPVNAAIADLRRYIDNKTMPYYVEPRTRLLLLSFNDEQKAECRDKLLQQDATRHLAGHELESEINRHLTDAAVVDFRVGLQNYIDAVDAALKVFNTEHFHEVLEERKLSLGKAFNRHDYDDSVKFRVEVREKTIVPPSYHGAISPELKRLAVEQFQKDCVAAKSHMIDAAVDSFQDMLARLYERMAGKDDGKPKVFRDSLITNLNDGIAQFSQSLQSRGLSSSQLDQAVSDIQGLLKHIGSPDSLRSKNYRSGRSMDVLRGQVATQVSGIYERLNEALIIKPPRKLSDSPLLKKNQATS